MLFKKIDRLYRRVLLIGYYLADIASHDLLVILRQSRDGGILFSKASREEWKNI